MILLLLLEESILSFHSSTNSGQDHIVRDTAHVANTSIMTEPYLGYRLVDALGA